MRTPARCDAEALAAQAEADAAALDVAPPEPLPMVAIVGRPNVGKSTLFNRLIGRRVALVHERPGMTRDRRIERVDAPARPFLLVDTGGYDAGLDDPLAAQVVEQARLALTEADLIVWLVEVGQADHPVEQELVQLLRSARKPILLAVNKCDHARRDLEAQEFFRHGLATLHPISALHGRGMDALREALDRDLAALPPTDRRPYASGGIAVALVGRQNVGKSSLLNRLLGQERVITSDAPGTTRDAVDATLVTPEGQVFTLIDTAGIRRRGRIERGAEQLSVLSSLLAIRRADVAILVLDGAEGPTAQDAHIAGAILEAGAACVLAVNKWDLVEKDHRTADAFTAHLAERWGFLDFAPVVYVSALTGQRVPRLLDLARRVDRNASRRIATPRLNELLLEWTRRRPLPPRKGRAGRIKYGAQVAVRPPTFVLFVNDPALVHFSYRRHIIRCLREVEDFEGAPVRLILKPSGPAKGAERRRREAPARPRRAERRPR